MSDCHFHDLSFPNDICGFIVLVNKPVFAVLLVSWHSHVCAIIFVFVYFDYDSILKFSLWNSALLCLFSFIHMWATCSLMQWAYYLIYCILFCDIFTLCTVFFYVVITYLLSDYVSRDWPFDSYLALYYRHHRLGPYLDHIVRCALLRVFAH